MVSIVVMGGADSRVVGQAPVAPGEFDSDSAEWLRALAAAGPVREAALARLQEMLLRIARSEVRDV